MTEAACKPLADHLAERKSNGLVDIKFYVHNSGDASVKKVCAEATAVFEAIGRGRTEPFKFGDRHPMPAEA